MIASAHTKSVDNPQGEKSFWDWYQCIGITSMLIAGSSLDEFNGWASRYKFTRQDVTGRIPEQRMNRPYPSRYCGRLYSSTEAYSASQIRHIGKNGWLQIANDTGFYIDPLHQLPVIRVGAHQTAKSGQSYIQERDNVILRIAAIAQHYAWQHLPVSDVHWVALEACYTQLIYSHLFGLATRYQTPDLYLSEASDWIKSDMCHELLQWSERQPWM